MSQSLSDPSGVPIHILDEPVLGKLLGDLARKMFTTDEIADRYQVSKLQLKNLLMRPEIFRRYQTMKALWESDDNSEARLRMMARVGIGEALPTYFVAMMDPKTPLTQKTDLLKVMGRLGGVDAMPAQAGQGGATIAPVSISFHFGKSGKTETFTTVVEPPTIEGEPAGE